MTSIEGKKIVLIGGAGFIGHNLALELKKRGAVVDIIDSMQVNNLLSFTLSSNKIANRDLYWRILNERIELLHKADIEVNIQDARDYHALSRLLTAIKPQVIIHLSAVAHAGKSNKAPHDTFDHSLRTLENSLDWARDGIEKFIYLSSSMVYGHFPAGFVTEETPCEPLGIYGALKYSGEKIVIAYNQVFDLPYTIIRPSALYGERCVSRRVGQIFIENALIGKNISINGDGSEQLDFTYIDDFVNGVIQCILHDEAKNQVFNLTYGQSRSIGEMADIIREYFPDVQITYLPKDKFMPDRGTLSVEKAKKLVGYTPQFPLDKGYRKYIEWYKSEEALFRS